MSTIRGRRFDLARVTIELLSPARLPGQQSLSPWDAEFVRDANGLPTIAGTSLAGMLRHAYARQLGEDQGAEDPEQDATFRALFGYQARDEGAASAVAVSFAQVHGADDRPVAFRRPRATTREPADPVLALLRAGVLRDHVKLDARGVADDRAKFDELLVPAGARFTFELTVTHSPRVGSEEFKSLLGLLSHPCCRLGGSGRRGLGRFKVVRIEARTFDLAEPKDRRALGRLPVDLSRPVPKGVLSPPSLEATDDPTWLRATMFLQPEDFWMIGGGQPNRAEHLLGRRRTDRRDEAVAWESKAVDRVAVTEACVTWDTKTGRGAVRAEERACYYVPGSAVKGALRHRTEFHLRRRKGWFAGDEARWEAQCERALEGLFGALKDDEGDGAKIGRPGRLYVEDMVVQGAKIGLVEHVSLDRFTMGPMPGLLFSEAPLWRGSPMRLELGIDTAGAAIDADLRAALGDALEDLIEGRLSLGAHGAKGYGFFEGQRPKWQGRDGSRWLRGEA